MNPGRRLEGVRRVDVQSASNGNASGSPTRQRLHVTCEKGDDMRARLSGFVAQQRWQLLLMRPQETSLEEVYLRVVAAEGSHA